ncbi:MAG: tRNA1(Val) (adenine(37)-N6)-methyltransferase [Treponemataceae bacterium]|nr:tRNA1(Val) (adenine(37)-N6)-methyltransferase [Treponemataceae bacterium]
MEKIETLHSGNFRFIQDPDRFCFGIDAVLLADFASARCTASKSHVVDLCTGNGIVPFLLAAKLLEKPVRKGRLTGLEIQPAAVDMARRSVALNKLENLIEIIECDIKNVFSVLPKNCADLVTANPPYMPYNHGKKSPSEDMAIARHEILCSLEDVVVAAAGLLNSNGLFFMIHRPERLAEIMESLVRNKLEPKRLRFVQPYEGSPPTMVLIESKKCASHGLVIEKPLVVYSGKKIYSPEMQKIYGKAE